MACPSIPDTFRSRRGLAREMDRPNRATSFFFATRYMTLCRKGQKKGYKKLSGLAGGRAGWLAISEQDEIFQPFTPGSLQRSKRKQVLTHKPQLVAYRRRRRRRDDARVHTREVAAPILPQGIRYLLRSLGGGGDDMMSASCYYCSL